MTRYFKAIRNLSHAVSGEIVTSGTYFSDEGNQYDPTIGTVDISTGDAIPNVKQAPAPIKWRKGFYASTPEDTINLLLGYAIVLVAPGDDDYAFLQTHGVIPAPPKPKKTVKDDE